MRTEGYRAVIATAMAVVSAALLITASAASLGGISVADLFVWSAPLSVPVPTVIGFDDFDCNGALDGQTDDQGNTWTNHLGNWRCVGQGEARAQERLPYAHATVDLGLSDHLYLTTLVSSVSSQSNRSGPGISFFSNGLSHMYVIYQRDQGTLSLGKLELILPSTLASVPIADRGSAEIRVEIDQPEVRVLVDGAPVISYTMTAAEISTFAANTRFGLEADNDSQSRFDWFRVES